jgi:tetratricopeptide (TPR) repeat protein
MNFRSVLTIWLSITLLAGCATEQTHTSETPSKDSLVKDQASDNVKAASLPIETSDKVNPAWLSDASKQVASQLNHSSVVKSYQKALSVIKDPQVKARVKRRLAGLAMMESEELQAEGETYEQQALALKKFDRTINAYNKLLADYPDHADNDKVYYQLAKAYGLKGQVAKSDKALFELLDKYPDSPLATEAHYRRAEFLYSHKKYVGASNAYKKVLERNDRPKYMINAQYMLAWSLFKQSEYQASVDHFTALLDKLAPSETVYKSLTKNQKALIEDSFRAMSYAFSYQEGGKSIVSHFEKTGKRHYESLVFSTLGMLYQSKERYKDAADTYLAYINRHPLAPDSPDVYARVIKVYELGRFPSVIIPAKEEYSTRYGITSDWNKAQETIDSSHTVRLKEYVAQLASYFHTRGQKVRKDQAKKEAHFNKAIGWYQVYIRDFPEEKDVAQKYHRAGDVFSLLKQPLNSANYYLKAAYDYPDYSTHDRSIAGYAAVVAYRDIATQSGLEKDKREKIKQSLKYAEAFEKDSRSISVLVDTSESLLALNDYAQARVVAQKVISKLVKSGKAQYTVDPVWNTFKWNNDHSAKYRKAAWVVMAHSSFELSDYKKAEESYLQALKLIKKKEKLYPSLRQRLAISIYRQGEHFVAKKENEKALGHFERVLVVVPEAKIKVQTQYDITAQHLILKQWAPAVKKLSVFRKRYPKHKLTPGIREKLIYAYEQSNRLPEAANELTAMANDKALDKELRRKALYQAAEYYEKGGKVVKAIDRYRTYAHNYAKPFVVNLETQNKLAELYRDRKEINKRKFWLKKIIKNDKNAGSERSPRSIYLAASASFELADDHWKKFVRTKLTLPLGKSIKRKQKAMQTVINKYTAVADYGVTEFATASTHRIADAYYRMSKDLMNSQRPKGLDELALEQYDILLEEQAYPFEETSIELYETNTVRTADGVYDDWVKESFSKLAEILPARYAKEEQVEGYLDVIQ